MISCCLFAIVFVFFASNTLAATVSVSAVNSTLTTASISNAINLYAYEINFSIDSGTIGSVQSFNFLGADSGETYGNSQRDCAKTIA